VIVLVASILLFAQQDPFPKAGADSVALHLDAARSRPWSLAIQRVPGSTNSPSSRPDDKR